MSEENTTRKSVDLVFYARLLIFFAIILLAYGFYLDNASENKLIDPVTGVKNTKKGESTITTIDIHHWDDEVDEVEIQIDSEKGSTSSDGKTNDDGKTVSGGSSSGGGKSSGSGSSSGKSGKSSGKSSGKASTKPGGNSSGGGSSSGGGGSTSPSPSPSSSPKPSTSPSPSPSQSPTPSSPSLTEINNNLRISIQNTYGITIKYGSETVGYSVGGLSTNPITSPSTINTTLNKLNTAMSLYPSGFFREIKNGGIPLTLYLVQSYSAYGVTGVTDSNYSFANVSVAVDYPFEETFFHESYHYIERYIFKRGLNYSSWNGYNPSGFTYGSLWRDQSFARTGAAGAYFVNDYAQTSAEEDRASTFEYMMANYKAPCLNNGKHIWSKASEMAMYVQNYFNTVRAGTTEYWERYL